MKITEVKTYTAGEPDGRKFLFCRVYTDEGIYGVGEASAWAAIQTEIHNKASVIIGEDPFNIERCWSKMFLQTHGMAGVVTGGAISAIETALWDIKGKAFGVPVWQLLGGRMRETLRCYTHADTPEKARELVDEGYNGLKMGGVEGAAKRVADMRAEVGDDVDIMADLHGPPWMTTRDAISMGRVLEDYGIFFYEEPVAPENPLRGAADKMLGRKLLPYDLRQLLCLGGVMRRDKQEHEVRCRVAELRCNLGGRLLGSHPGIRCD